MAGYAGFGSGNNEENERAAQANIVARLLSAISPAEANRAREAADAAHPDSLFNRGIIGAIDKTQGVFTRGAADAVLDLPRLGIAGANMGAAAAGSQSRIPNIPSAISERDRAEHPYAATAGGAASTALAAPAGAMALAPRLVGLGKDAAAGAAAGGALTPIINESEREKEGDYSGADSRDWSGAGINSALGAGAAAGFGALGLGSAANALEKAGSALRNTGAGVKWSDIAPQPRQYAYAGFDNALRPKKNGYEGFKSQQERDADEFGGVQKSYLRPEDYQVSLDKDDKAARKTLAGIKDILDNTEGPAYIRFSDPEYDKSGAKSSKLDAYDRDAKEVGLSATELKGGETTAGGNYRPVSDITDFQELLNRNKNLAANASLYADFFTGVNQGFKHLKKPKSGNIYSGEPLRDKRGRIIEGNDGEALLGNIGDLIGKIPLKEAKNLKLNGSLPAAEMDIREGIRHILDGGEFANQDRFREYLAGKIDNIENYNNRRAAEREALGDSFTVPIEERLKKREELKKTIKSPQTLAFEGSMAHGELAKEPNYKAFNDWLDDFYKQTFRSLPERDPRNSKNVHEYLEEKKRLEREYKISKAERDRLTRALLQEEKRMKSQPVEWANLNIPHEDIIALRNYLRTLDRNNAPKIPFNGKDYDLDFISSGQTPSFYLRDGDEVIRFSDHWTNQPEVSDIRGHDWRISGDPGKGYSAGRGSVKELKRSSKNWQ